MLSDRCRRYVRVLLTAAAVCIAGCAKYELSDRQVAFNNALEDADNRQILLNALRASRRYPLFFTAVGQITSMGVLDGSSVSVNIPFGVPHNLYSVNPILRLQEGLTIATSPLNTQEFFQGFLAPVDPILFAYYLDNGWNQELIYYNFIREIDLPEAILDKIKEKVLSYCGNPRGILECIHLPNSELLTITAADKCTGFTFVRDARGEIIDLSIPPYLVDGRIDKIPAQVFKNQPADPCELLLFEYVIEQLRALDLRGVEIPEAELSADHNKSKTTGSDADMVNTGQDAKGAASNEGKFAFAINIDDPCNAKTGRTLGSAREKQIAALAEARRITIFGARTRKLASPDVSDACKAVSNMAVAVRSPEAMIFYMGELIRAQSESIIPKINVFRGIKRTPEPLFIVNIGEDVVVTVSLDGENYYVAGDQVAGQSMHLISLVEQVFALQKKGSELPKIPTVQVIGQ